MCVSQVVPEQIFVGLTTLQRENVLRFLQNCMFKWCSCGEAHVFAVGVVLTLLKVHVLDLHCRLPFAEESTVCFGFPYAS
jgi:hypothetical protein